MLLLTIVTCTSDDHETPPTEVPSPALFSGYVKPEVDACTESNHDTPLTLACAGGHEELVQLLLANGASIEHRDKKGNNCNHNNFNYIEDAGM